MKISFCYFVRLLFEFREVSKSFTLQFDTLVVLDLSDFNLCAKC